MKGEEMTDDLISREKLKKHYAWWANGSEMDKLYKSVFDEIINQQPTVEAVCVVRCKDCVHHIDAPKTTDVWCERIDGLLQRNWFCADGERETKGED